MRQNFTLSAFPSKAAILLLLLVLATGCIPSTRYTSSVGGCPTALASGEKVLIGEAAGVTANRSYELYQRLEPQAREAGLQPAYAVEQDMYLRMHGIRPGAATDTSNLAKMQQMGYGYYLQLSVGNQAAGMGYTSVSAGERREMQHYGGAPDSDNTSATIKFELYSTQARKLVYTLTATTEMAGVTLPGRDQGNGYSGSTSVNMSTIGMAVGKALQKGAKRLLEDCKCCRE